MDEEQKKSDGFKIADKRRFDAQGDTREGIEAAKSFSEIKGSGVGKSIGKEPVTKPAEVQRTSEAPPQQIDFSSHLVSLATTALIHLGAIKAPEGVAVEVNRDAAKQMIEIIEMLQIKTKGNLDPNETNLIQEILMSLRLAFVRAGG